MNKKTEPKIYHLEVVARGKDSTGRWFCTIMARQRVGRRWEIVGVYNEPWCTGYRQGVSTREEASTLRGLLGAKYVEAVHNLDTLGREVLAARCGDDVQLKTGFDALTR